MVKLKEGLGKGTSELALGLVGLSPWAILIGLIVIAVIGIILWATLILYGLTTAFVFFCGGMLFLWLLNKMGMETNEKPYLVLMPIFLGVGGYFIEKFGVYKISMQITFPTYAVFGLPEEVTWGIETILLATIMMCCLIETLSTFRKPHRRR